MDRCDSCANLSDFSSKEQCGRWYVNGVLAEHGFKHPPHESLVAKCRDNNSCLDPSVYVWKQL